MMSLQFTAAILIGMQMIQVFADPLTKCQRINKETKTHMIGRFIPTCAASGKFAVKQMWGSTGYSWCVDENTGEQIEGTEVPPGPRKKPEPDCEGLQKKQIDTESATVHSTAVTSQLTKCQQINAETKGRRLGQFIPTCAASGKFAVKQSWGSTGTTWCVDENTGEKIEGTEVPPGPRKKPEPDCEGLQKKQTGGESATAQ